MFPTLSDEQRRFVSTVRELAQSEFRERAQRYMDGTFPWENMKALAGMGVLGMAVPEEYGGLGLPVFDTALVLEEIAKSCYVTAMAVLGEVECRPGSSPPMRRSRSNSASCRRCAAASASSRSA